MLNNEQLQTIISMQVELDLKIAQTRMVEDDEKILTAKFLALLVELGEFANEQRCFKYWSSKPSSNKQVLLEEYIDGLHFIISIANNLNLNLLELKIIEQEYSDLNLAFIDLFALTLKLMQERSLAVINQWFNIYYLIAKQCQFSKEDIFYAYLDKNKINHLRQEQDY